VRGEGGRGERRESLRDFHVEAIWPTPGRPAGTDGARRNPSRKAPEAAIVQCGKIFTPKTAESPRPGQLVKPHLTRIPSRRRFRVGMNGYAKRRKAGRRRGGCDTECCFATIGRFCVAQYWPTLPSTLLSYSGYHTVMPLPNISTSSHGH
jgi:hypothetical protein